VVEAGGRERPVDGVERIGDLRLVEQRQPAFLARAPNSVPGSMVSA
jgi:hypothetical protein